MDWALRIFSTDFGSGIQWYNYGVEEAIGATASSAKLGGEQTKSSCCWHLHIHKPEVTPFVLLQVSGCIPTVLVGSSPKLIEAITNYSIYTVHTIRIYTL